MTTDLGTDAAGILRRHGLRPKHSLGQNFLDDPLSLQRVVDAADVSSKDTVLEVGTGIGSLTRFLARAAHRVVGIELDAALAAICRIELGEQGNVEIVDGDILDIRPADLGLPPGYLVAANIPYYITSAILRHILESVPRPRRIVLTVQKEVAARISAKPPEMSLLAVSVQIHGTAHVIGEIPARAFYPRPKVDSAILRIDCFDGPRLAPALLARFFRVAKAGFLQPRKMLRNSMSAGLHVAPVEIESVLKRADIDPRRRAETLSVEEWVRVSEMLNPSRVQ